MPVYSLVVAAGAKRVMVVAGAVTVDVLVDMAVVDGVVPFRAASNQKPCRRCPPCPAATIRRTFRCHATEVQ
jgi:hypothetical protein